jgi:hypothetical protein
MNPDFANIIGKIATLQKMICAGFAYITGKIT